MEMIIAAIGALLIIGALLYRERRLHHTQR
jgi:hypothetical protein